MIVFIHHSVILKRKFTRRKQIKYTFDGSSNNDEEYDEEVYHSEDVVRQRGFLGSKGKRGWKEDHKLLQLLFLLLHNRVTNQEVTSSDAWVCNNKGMVVSLVDWKNRLITCKHQGDGESEEIRIRWHELDIDRRRRYEGLFHGVIEERVDVRAETTHNAGCADYVLQNQGPTDDKRHEFAHRDVAVNVRGSSAWHSCAEFRVTEACRDNNFISERTV